MVILKGFAKVDPVRYDHLSNVNLLQEKPTIRLLLKYNSHELSLLNSKVIA